MRYRYNKATDEVEPVVHEARSTNDWKPLHCEAMGVDGCTADQARAIDAQLGAPLVDYDSNMCPVFHDKSTYNKYLKAHGYVNRTSGKGTGPFSPDQFEQAKRRVMEQYDAVADSPKEAM